MCFTLPCSLGSATGFLMVRSRGASWSAIRSLLRTGFWLCAGPVSVAAGLVAGGTPESKGGVDRLWSEWGWESEQLTWGELVFEVYSAANCLIIFWRISRATTGICGSEKFGTSRKKNRDKYFSVSIPLISHQSWLINMQQTSKLCSKDTVTVRKKLLFIALK